MSATSRFTSSKNITVDLSNISSFVALLVAVSMAAERLVEIIKGFSSKLSNEVADADGERKRKLILHLLAVAAGILTACLLPESALGKGVKNPWLTKLSIGFLASGGSSFWNSILSYLNLVKQAKRVEVATLRAAAPVTTATGARR